MTFMSSPIPKCPGHGHCWPSGLGREALAGHSQEEICQECSHKELSRQNYNLKLVQIWFQTNLCRCSKTFMLVIFKFQVEKTQKTNLASWHSSKCGFKYQNLPANWLEIPKLFTSFCFRTKQTFCAKTSGEESSVETTTEEPLTMKFLIDLWKTERKKMFSLLFVANFFQHQLWEVKYLTYKHLRCTWIKIKAFVINTGSVQCQN